MLAMLTDNARTAGVTNIKAIRSTQTDTKLPEGKVDLALMVDVYHEASNPEALLQGIKKALKPGGRLVLVEFRGEDPEVPIKPEHKMTLKQVRKEVEPQGLPVQGEPRVPPLAAHHHLREAGRPAPTRREADRKMMDRRPKFMLTRPD